MSLFACGKPYRGDGSLIKLERTYVPIIAVTRGYIVDLPEFRADKDVTRVFNLDGLPRLNDSFTIEISTHLPTHRMTPEELERVDLSVPAAHEIHCRLFDGNSNQTIAEATAQVSSLPQSAMIELRNAPFVKEILRVPTERMPARTIPRLRIDYRTHGVPLRRTMKILVANEAPLG